MKFFYSNSRNFLLNFTKFFYSISRKRFYSISWKFFYSISRILFTQFHEKIFTLFHQKILLNFTKIFYSIWRNFLLNFTKIFYSISRNFLLIFVNFFHEELEKMFGSIQHKSSMADTTTTTIKEALEDVATSVAVSEDTNTRWRILKKQRQIAISKMKLPKSSKILSNSLSSSSMGSGNS